MIRFQLNKKETYDDHIALGEALKQLIAEQGIDILKSSDAVSEGLKNKNISSNIIMQMILFLNASNISNYYTQTENGITMIDVNNIIICACEETGLTKKRIKYLLTAVLYALGMPTDIQFANIPSETGITEVSKCIVSPATYAEKLADIQKAIQSKDEKKISNLSTDLDAFVKAGIPEAMYLKGVCHMNGIGTETDMKVAYNYFAAAANMGHAEANAALGDYYASEENRNYTKSYEYYTQLGAVALSDERKDNLKTIIANVEQNVKQLVLSGILLVILLIFNMRMGSGMFEASGQAHWVIAVISDIILCGIYGLSIFQFKTLKYDEIKWATTVMIIVFTITTFIALV